MVGGADVDFGCHRCQCALQRDELGEHAGYTERDRSSRMTDHRSSPGPARLRRWLGPLLVLLLASATFGTRYWEPKSLFWDENYHVAAAHKQLAGTLYMEAHPPLGKMLIAAGEWLVGANAGADLTRSLQRDHIGNADLPAHYSYAGVRLPSVLSMILAAPVLFLLLTRITRSRWLALVGACLLVFDNALLVHTRAAMLEGPQILLVLLSLLLFAHAVQAPRVRLRHYLGLGVLVGLVAAVKLNGLVLLLLFPALFVVDQWPRLHQRDWPAAGQRLATSAALSIAALVTTFLAIWWLHIATVTQVHANRTYKASPDYLAHLQAGTAWTPSGFVVGLRDQWRYLREYASGVPRLDVCKPGENGSHASGWPLGGKTINYRWNRETVDGQSKVSYTYLVGNPLVWWPVLAGIVLSLGLVMARLVFGAPVVDQRLFWWMALASTLWVAYMVAILRIERVMYLYHYLLPLLFGILNLAALAAYLLRDGLASGRRHTRLNLLGYLGLVALAFWFFAPLTYGWPLSTEEFELRQWLDFWKLEPVR